VTPYKTFTGQCLVGANRAQPELGKPLAVCLARIREGMKVAKAKASSG
jgi:hypothetical protein